MGAIIAIAIVLLVPFYVVVVSINAAINERKIRKQRKETEAIRYMDSAELAEYLNNKIKGK
jgi:uncharacterized membrane protein YjjP (DUF1212 family)